MLRIRYTAKFKKDFKVIQKRGYNIKLMEEVISFLCQEIKLPEKYKDHSLGGNYSEFRECHITPDWILIYKIEKNNLILTLTRTGTHSDLF